MNERPTNCYFCKYIINRWYCTNHCKYNPFYSIQDGRLRDFIFEDFYLEIYYLTEHIEERTEIYSLKDGTVDKLLITLDFSILPLLENFNHETFKKKLDLYITFQ